MLVCLTDIWIYQRALRDCYGVIRPAPAGATNTTSPSSDTDRLMQGLADVLLQLDEIGIEPAYTVG
jgi:hypothetical protein